jgi:hypothetical protein
VGWVFGTISVTLAVLLVWGLLAPRSQWRTLRAWSVADPHDHEPGGAVYGWLRLASAVGVVGLGVVGVVAAGTAVANMPKPPPPLSALQIMWGSPAPQLLDRVSANLAEPPADLVEIPILGYQDFDNGIPSYLLDLRKFTMLGDPDPAGMTGVEPEEGTSAIGASNLLVHVRGPVLCIPRAIVVIETETTVQVGVFYGAPDHPEGEAVDHVASCSPDDPVTGSLLIPVQLSGPVLDREVRDLTGEPIDYVRVPD